MEKFKSALEAFLRNEIKRKELTEQIEQLLKQDPKCSTQLLLELENWQKPNSNRLLNPRICNTLKSQIEQFDKINRQDAASIPTNPRPQGIKSTNKPNNKRSSGASTSQSSWSIFQDGNDEEIVLEPNVVIRDNYRLIELIGEGGMGVVWKAIDLVQEAGDSRNPYFAIKFLSRKFKRHPDALKALVREFARYQRLNHPNIVRAYALSHMGGTAIHKLSPFGRNDMGILDGD
ncbi:serine/threonine protein kinase [Candidatus Thiomargarita nelsonii]|uniref:Serine/threonine protein kinase n=1 Tax=Candidatus Thiomargarita nelsonii TaxID=1003181 RepID=A0A176S7I9_9GAMM|nr:serine/threonine protein kinase [Candidatus Thiomargarita nelsonii]